MALEELLHDIDDDWREAGACVGVDADLFFPVGEELEKIAAAKSVCATCPVRDDCLQYSIATNQTEGVWGGLTPAERRRLRRRLMEERRRAAS